MVNVVTINRPDIVTLIEDAAQKMTGGNKTEAVALAMRRLLEQTARTRSLFDAHPDSVRFATDYDPFAPALEVIPEAQSGAETDR